MSVGNSVQNLDDVVTGRQSPCCGSCRLLT